jgi:hypothetical protein
MTARRISVSVGRGSGAEVVSFVHLPRCDFQPEVLEVGKCDATDQRMSCSPFHDRPSNAPRPNSCLSCWYVCSQSQRLDGDRQVRSDWCLKSNFRSPLLRHSRIS